MSHTSYKWLGNAVKCRSVLRGNYVTDFIENNNWWAQMSTMAIMCVGSLLSCVSEGYLVFRMPHVISWP